MQILVLVSTFERLLQLFAPLLGVALSSIQYLLDFGRVGQCGLARRCAERLALLVASRGGCPLPVQQQNHSVINRKTAHQDAEMPGMQH